MKMEGGLSSSSGTGQHFEVRNLKRGARDWFHANRSGNFKRLKKLFPGFEFTTHPQKTREIRPVHGRTLCCSAECEFSDSQVTFAKMGKWTEVSTMDKLHLWEYLTSNTGTQSDSSNTSHMCYFFQALVENTENTQTQTHARGLIFWHQYWLCCSPFL